MTSPFEKETFCSITSIKYYEGNRSKKLKICMTFLFHVRSKLLSNKILTFEVYLSAF